MNRSTHRARLLACAAALTLFATAGASASLLKPKFTFSDLECAQLGCGYLPVSPDIYLYTVSPSPLPEVTLGSPQPIELVWTQKAGLRTRFQLCITAASGAAPAAADDCMALPNPTIQSTTKTHVTFNDQVTIPSALRKAEADFYLRSSPIFVLGAKQDKLSNRIGFVWPLPLPNLSIEGAGIDIHPDWTIDAKVDVYNPSNVDAYNVEVELVMTLCDGRFPAPVRPGADSRNDILCYGGTSTYLSTISLGTITLPFVPASPNLAETVRIDVTQRLPATPRSLVISVFAVVDPQNLIQESNESPESNMDDGTEYALRP